MGLYSSNLPLSSPYLSDFARVKVEEGSTAFAEGRQYRLLHDFALAVGATQVLRVVTTKDLILANRVLRLDYGYVQLEVVVGGTPGGTFDTPVPAYPMNTMSSPRNRRQTGTAFPDASETTVTVGGTLTGGTAVDRVRLNTSVTAQAQTVGSELFIPRGFAPGTYYVRLTNLDVQESKGILYYTWEEISPDAEEPDSQYL